MAFFARMIPSVGDRQSLDGNAVTEESNFEHERHSESSDDLLQSVTAGNRFAGAKTGGPRSIDAHCGRNGDKQLMATMVIALRECPGSWPNQDGSSGLRTDEGATCQNAAPAEIPGPGSFVHYSGCCLRNRQRISGRGSARMISEPLPIPSITEFGGREIRIEPIW